ncbi:hypothetical protein ACXIUT_15220 [Achromobacter denitrificans]
MTTKHTPGPVFISPDLVYELNEKHGWFQFGDAQSDVSNAFANEAIARYERIRSAAPELLEALESILPMLADWHDEFPDHVGDKEAPAVKAALAAISKAKGEHE